MKTASQLPKIENFYSSNGNEVPNQFMIRTENGTYFQSYKSMIAYIDRNSGEVVLDEKYWNYSATTNKYRGQFLGEGVAETRKKIESGKYKLANLNA